jgi:hypothetical protein
MQGALPPPHGRAPDLQPQALGHGGCGGQIGAGQQHDEFLLPQAGQHVHLAQRGATGLGQGLDHLVAVGVAVGIADLLEIIDIGDQQGQGRALGPGLGEGLVRLVEEMAAVGNTGQGIPSGILARLGFRPPTRLDFLGQAFIGPPQQGGIPIAFPQQAADAMGGLHAEQVEGDQQQGQDQDIVVRRQEVLHQEPDEGQRGKHRNHRGRQESVGDEDVDAQQHDHQAHAVPARLIGPQQGDGEEARQGQAFHQGGRDALHEWPPEAGGAPGDGDAGAAKAQAGEEDQPVLLAHAHRQVIGDREHQVEQDRDGESDAGLAHPRRMGGLAKFRLHPRVGEFRGEAGDVVSGGVHHPARTRLTGPSTGRCPPRCS